MNADIKAKVNIYNDGHLVGAWEKTFSTYKRALKEVLSNVPLTYSDFPTSLVVSLDEGTLECTIHYHSIPVILKK